MSYSRPYLGWICLLIIGVGVLIRMGFAGYYAEDLYLGDAGDYHEMALQLLSGEPFPVYWPPGLPAYLAFFYLCLGTQTWVSVFAMLLLYIGLASFLMLLCRPYLHSSLQIGLQILLAIYPSFIFHSVVPLTPMLIAWCGLALILSLQTFRDSGKKIWLLVAGVVLSLAVMTRPGSLSLLLLLPYWAWREKFSLAFVKNFAICFLPLILALLLWQNQQQQMNGYTVFINEANAYNVFLGNHPTTPNYKTWWLGSHDERGNPAFSSYYTELDSIQGLAPSQQNAAFRQQTFTHIVKAPGPFILRSINRLRCFAAFDTYAGANLVQKNLWIGILALGMDAGLYILLGLLLIIGLFFSRRSPQGHYLVLGMLAYALPYGLAFSHPTYHFPLLPVGMLLIAQTSIEHTSSAGAWQAKWMALDSGQKKWLVAGLLLFLAIQLEWIYFMA